MPQTKRSPIGVCPLCNRDLFGPSITGHIYLECREWKTADPLREAGREVTELVGLACRAGDDARVDRLLRFKDELNHAKVEPPDAAA